MPITRHGSLLFLRPALALVNKEEFEVACNTFHNSSAQGTIVASVLRPLVQYHVDKWELSGNTLTRIHKRARATFFSREGTKDRPVDLKDLADECVTYFEYADGRKETFTDNWRKAQNPKGPASERFVGKTVFKPSSKPTGRKVVSKQSTLPQPEPALGLYSHNDNRSRPRSQNFQQRPHKHLSSSQPKASRSKAPKTLPSALGADLFRNAGKLSEGFA